MDRESELRTDSEEAPFGEDYWQALLQEGERSTGAVLPVEEEEVWSEFGTEPGMAQAEEESPEELA